jgi:hypothetical protein
MPLSHTVEKRDGSLAMPGIHSDVQSHLLQYPEERAILAPFAASFFVTWGRRRFAYNTEMSVYFLRPDPAVSDAFGIDREVFLCISSYPTLQPRTMQGVEQIIQEDPARGRVEGSVYFLASGDRNARTWAQSYNYENPQARIPVVFSFDELKSLPHDPWALLNLIGQQLFYRDLFDNQLPVMNELFFFGRDALTADIIDAVRKIQNRGLFGLRKTGKTSVLYKVRRVLQETGSATVLFYDSKLPSIRNLTANEFLLRIISDLERQTKVSFTDMVRSLHPSEAFVRVCSHVSARKPLCIIFDEIEYVSPLAILDQHWKKDFIPFWQTLWSAQSEARRCSFIIAGVNPTVVETDSYAGIQNPMFGIIKPTYLKGLEFDALNKMITFIGSRMGLRFDESAVTHLFQRYGGHPLLTRMACSYIHSQVSSKKIVRPYDISAALISRDDQARDADLTFYCRHIVSELKDFYPLEYLMLDMLAGSNVKEFMDSSSDPDLIRHIAEYGLIRFDEARRPSFAIPVVGRYVASERARIQGSPLRREIIPAPRRVEWLDRRKSALLREARALQVVLRDAGSIQLFAGDSPAETEKFWQVGIVHDEKDFVSFINTMNRSFVEAIEKYGMKLGKPTYLRDDVRKALPELWEALQRIKVYRHRHDHLELYPGVEEAFRTLVSSDLEGKFSAEDVKDGWFVLQQVVLDELLVGTQCGLNRYA